MNHEKKIQICVSCGCTMNGKYCHNCGTRNRIKALFDKKELDLIFQFSDYYKRNKSGNSPVRDSPISDAWQLCALLDAANSMANDYLEKILSHSKQ